MHASSQQLCRIALTGAHGTGKSTLAHDLERARTGWQVVEEPYRLMEAEGHVFADPPTRSDFEDQLQRSLADVANTNPPAIFDRCPVDLYAYLLALGDWSADAASYWFNEVRTAIAAVDLLVFVPIEQPDRIAGASAPRLRREVDQLLRAGLIEDEWGLGTPVLEVSGTPQARVAQVLEYIPTLAIRRAAP